MSETQSQSQPKADLKGSLSQLENLLDDYLGKKAPKLPENIKDVIVNFAPWLIVLGILMAIPAFLAVIGMGALFGSSLFLAGAGVAALAPTYYLSLVILAISVVIEIIALPHLFAKRKQGWRLLFFASLVSAVYQIFSISIGGIIGVVIGLYILFQVKDKYQ